MQALPNLLDSGGAGMRRRVSISILALSLSLLLVACGGGGGDKALLPAPPEGKATIGGKLARDGEPLVDEEVELQVDGRTRSKVETDSSGRFVFTGVTPGSYVLYTSPEVERGPTSELEAPGVPQVACEAPGFEESLLGSVVITSEGGTRYFTLWPLESESLHVNAGDQVVKDIDMSCERPEG